MELRSAVGVLIILHNRHQGAAHREARSVQSMHRAHLAFAAKAAFIRRAWKSPQLEQDEISR